MARVVAAVMDPHPLTRGRGLARLRRAGLSVVSGVRAREATALNAPFWSVMTTGLPWVIAKVGQSLDGKIATRSGASRWITSPVSRRLGHAWRSRVDAILVGVNTILVDDPRLTVRGAPRRPGRPVRVIVDSRLRTPFGARCLKAQASAPTLIATTVSSRAKRARFLERGIQVLTLPPCRGRVPLDRLCRELARRGIHSLLIEGGGEVLASALSERLVRRLVWCIAPILIGGREAPGSVGGVGIGRLEHAIRLADVHYHPLGPDLCVEGRVVYQKTGDRRQVPGDRKTQPTPSQTSRCFSPSTSHPSPAT
jgi:diaminohydroxyphosphoribosylaminopyrimidine deaminase/5-amino-6-(5-phosphoribosylamino)uracil reductase